MNILDQWEAEIKSGAKLTVQQSLALIDLVRKKDEILKECDLYPNLSDFHVQDELNYGEQTGRAIQTLKMRKALALTEELK